MLEIRKIRVNYLENPSGISGNAQFGWVIGSDRRDVRQSAYRLQISEDGTFEETAYDSGKRECGESAHIFADGFSPKELTRYFVRVKVWDNCGEESEWSRTAAFLSALASPESWHGSFITAERRGDEELSKGTYVRGTFTVAKPLRSAYAAVTACGLYHFFLNGKKVGRSEFAPGWTSYQKRLLYQVYDVTEYLREGANAAGAHLGAGWYKGTMGFNRRKHLYGDTTAFAGELRLNYEDGTSEIIATDGGWTGHDSPVLFSEIYDGEIYDARLEQTGFGTVDFAGEDWHPVRVLSVDCGILTAQEGRGVEEMDELPAKRVFSTPQGDTVIDFGQNLTGWVHFRVRGQAGDRVKLQHFETLDAQGNVYLDNLRTAKEQVVYICRGDGEETFHPNFSFQGFQYVRVDEYPGEVRAEDFTAYAVHSSMEETGSFSCSNADLNQLAHNIKWGLKGNFLDVPTDCPQRDERLGWTGDAQIFCRTASYLMNTYSFFKKWLADVAADQTAEGGVPHVVPDILTEKTDGDWLVDEGADSAAAWADVAVIAPWTLYLTFGDKEIIKDQYESMKAWIEFMRAHEANGTWSYKRQFGDWVALDAEEGSYFGATPNELICAAYYAYSTGLFAKMARSVGCREDAGEYGKLYERLKADYQKHFMKDGHMAVHTQTAQIVSLYFDLVPEEYKRNVAEDLLKLLEKHGGHLVTGFVGTPYFCHALSMSGHTKEAYELLLKDDFPSWLYQVKMGATTVWEHWDGKKPDGTMWSPDMNSFNHYAYGAIGEWLYRVAAGIEASEDGPGYKRFIVQPHIGGGLAFAEGRYESVYGTIVSRWEDDNGAIRLCIRIPHNTEAQILLDRAEEVLDADGLAFHPCGQTMRAQAGSGEYVIRYRMKG